MNKNDMVMSSSKPEVVGYVYEVYGVGNVLVNEVSNPSNYDALIKLSDFEVIEKELQEMKQAVHHYLNGVNQQFRANPHLPFGHWVERGCVHSLMDVMERFKS